MERIAQGQIEVASERPSSPVDIMKFNSSKKEDLQGVALIASARLGSREPDLYRTRVEVLLDEAFSSPEVEIRRGAFIAFRDFPVRSEGALLAVLLGTRDSDPGGAIAAFAALTGKPDLNLDQNHWSLLLYSVRLSSHSPNPKLRRHAALLISRLIDRAPAGAIAQKCEDLKVFLSGDICASVREVFGLSRPRE